MIIFLLLACLLFPVSSWAACSWSGNTGTVASPYGVTQVGECVTDASSKTGAVIIQIPNATVTWSGTLSINMQSGFANVTGLTLRGQNDCSVDADGRASTCGVNLTNARINITGSANKKWAIEHLRIAGTSWFEVYGNSVMPTGGWRIGYIYWNQTSGGRPVTVLSRTYGVVHNCYFNRIGDGSIYVAERYIGTGAQGGSYDYGITSWYNASSLGTYDNVIIEDNTWYDTSTVVSNMTVDVVDGGRIVYRYNKHTNCWGGTHDLSSTTSVRSWEFYNNTFTFTSDPETGGAIGLRGGTGVIYSNTMTCATAGDCYAGLWSYTNYRSNSAVLMGQCDSTTEKYCIGAGVTGETSYSGPCTTDANCGGVSGGCVQVDTHTIANGWPCRQQIGTKENQGLLPALSWNNSKTIGGVTTHATAYILGNGYTTHIVEDRDWCDGTTTMPASCNSIATTYTPYTYPHPLRGESASLPTVTGVTCVGCSIY